MFSIHFINHGRIQCIRFSLPHSYAFFEMNTVPFETRFPTHLCPSFDAPPPLHPGPSPAFTYPPSLSPFLPTPTTPLSQESQQRVPTSPAQPGWPIPKTKDYETIKNVQRRSPPFFFSHTARARVHALMELGGFRVLSRRSHGGCDGAP